MPICVTVDYAPLNHDVASKADGEAGEKKSHDLCLRGCEVESVTVVCAAEVRK